MTDHHIHIGQFNEIYYDAFKVFEAIEAGSAEIGIDEIHYSSTSSCRNDVELEKIEEEISYAQQFESQSLSIKPYLWFTTSYSEKDISVKSAIQTFDYCGIKLHPFAHRWDFSNLKHKKTLEQIFEWSSETKKPILIHTGASRETVPNRFELFFKEYPNSKVILAHSNPIKETAKMMNKYKNVFCDISCVKSQNIISLKKIVTSKEKILFGTDFPITNYFRTHLFEEKLNLIDQYKSDCRVLQQLSN